MTTRVCSPSNTQYNAPNSGTHLCKVSFYGTRAKPRGAPDTTQSLAQATHQKRWPAASSSHSASRTRQWSATRYNGANQEALRVAQLDIFMENARPGFCTIVYGDEEKCREATAARVSRVMTF